MNLATKLAVQPRNFATKIVEEDCATKKSESSKLVYLISCVT